jgi:hypothetical protein
LAKHLASVQALKNLAPTLYSQWKLKFKRVTPEAASDLPSNISAEEYFEKQDYCLNQLLGQPTKPSNTAISS